VAHQHRQLALDAGHLGGGLGHAGRVVTVLLIGCTIQPFSAAATSRRCS
jgi:hypothetical protein